MESECPFCPFKSLDSYSLMEHVECCHPENGFSPFNVKEEATMPRLAGGRDDEASGSFNALSHEEDYFQCACGEVVMLPEVNSHFALHETEQTTVDEAVPASSGQEEMSATLSDEAVALASLADSETYPGIHSSSKSHVKHRSRVSNHKSHHGVKDFMNVLLGSKSTSVRPKAARAKQKLPRRLGVRNSFVR